MLTVGIVEPQDAAGYLAALHAGASDPDWRCSPNLLVDVPSQAEIDNMVGSEVEVAIGCSEAGTRLGFMLFRPETGRIRWLLAVPARFVEVTHAMVVYAYQTYNVAPWGVIEGDTNRLDALGAHAETEITEQTTAPDGTVRSIMRWVPPT